MRSISAPHADPIYPGTTQSGESICRPWMGMWKQYAMPIPAQMQCAGIGIQIHGGWHAVVVFQDIWQRCWCAPGWRRAAYWPAFHLKKEVDAQELVLAVSLMILSISRILWFRLSRSLTSALSTGLIDLRSSSSVLRLKFSKSMPRRNTWSLILFLTAVSCFTRKFQFLVRSLDRLTSTQGR